MSEQYERDVEISRREAELAQAKALQAQERAEMAAALERVNKAQAERTEEAFVDNLRRAIRFTGLEESPNVDPNDFLAAVRGSMDFDIAPDGSFVPKNAVTKQYVDFSAALKAFASNNPKYFSIASVRRLQSKPNELSRDQMSQAEKIKFIEDHGFEKFEALPRTRPAAEPPIEQMTAEAWSKLPVARRSEITGKMGVAWLEQMLRETRRR